MKKQESRVLLFVLLFMAIPVWSWSQGEASRIIFNITIEDYHLTAGIINTIKIEVHNVENDAEDVVAQLQSNTPYIIVLEGGNTYLGDISEDQVKEFEALLAVSIDAPLGPYSLTLVLSYEDVADATGTINTLEYVLGVLVDSVEPYRIQIVSISRDKEDLTLTLENVGNETLKNIFVSLKHNEVLLGPPYEIHITEMPPGTRKVLTFHVTEDISSVEITINYGNTFESSILNIPAQKESDLVITCVYPSKRADVGTTIVYDLMIRNRGRETFYYLGVQGLPDSFTTRFVSGGSEVSGLYLKETQEEEVSLEIDLPIFLKGFIIDYSIVFSAVAIDTSTYIQIISESQSDWLDYAAGSLELTLTPTIRDILQIVGGNGENELSSPTSQFHYPGIPYFIMDLTRGEYVSPKFKLSGNTTYIFSLYGEYVGTDIDLNLRVFNASGAFIGSSPSPQGRSDTLEIPIVSSGTYIVVITNDETPSRSTASATLLITEKWDLKLRSSNTIELDEDHYPYFLIGEVRAMLVDVNDFQGQDMTLQVNRSSLLGVELRIYPFTRNSQKEDYYLLDPSYTHALSLIRSEEPQTLYMTFSIARDEETLLLVFTKVSGSGDLLVQMSFSSPLVDFWSLRRYRRELLLSLIGLAVIGLVVLAYIGEKYLR